MGTATVNNSHAHSMCGGWQGLILQCLPYYWKYTSQKTLLLRFHCPLQEKCEQYWPDKVNSSFTIGSDLIVTVVLYVPSAEYQIRKMQLKSVKNILSQIMDDDSLYFRGQSQSMNWL